MSDDLIQIPCISMWRPWAGWVANGFKTIETRTHKRLKSLVGRWVGIHATAKFDNMAVPLAADSGCPHEFHRLDLITDVTGLIALVHIAEWKVLDETDSEAAMICCDPKIMGHTKYGLVIDRVSLWGLPIPVKGAQGIFYRAIPKHLIPNE